ncbi:hypothetical protein QUA54_25465, partial [Microcoleus sp. MOSTC5]
MPQLAQKPVAWRFVRSPANPSWLNLKSQMSKRKLQSDTQTATIKTDSASEISLSCASIGSET